MEVPLYEGAAGPRRVQELRQGEAHKAQLFGFWDYSKVYKLIIEPWPRQGTSSGQLTWSVFRSGCQGAAPALTSSAMASSLALRS